MPSLCVFGRQDAAYREKVLGSVARVVIEAGSPDLWAKHVGSQALVIGVKGFGLSAPAEDLARHFGLTAPQITETVRAWLPSAAKVSA
jgi:transketolase